MAAINNHVATKQLIEIKFIINKNNLLTPITSRYQISPSNRSETALKPL